MRGYIIGKWWVLFLWPTPFPSPHESHLVHSNPNPIKPYGEGSSCISKYVD